MQQLTGMDASFLYSETPSTPNHISGLYLYDPSSAPGGNVSFATILDTIASRLGRAASFRQRLVRVPLDMDHPYWVQDATFDLEFHVREIALPRARRLAAALRADGPAPRPPARPDPGAVGDHRDQRARQRRRARQGIVRADVEDAPRRHRRCVGHRDPQRRPRPVGRSRAARRATTTWRPEPIPTARRAHGPRGRATRCSNPMRAQRALGRMVPAVAPAVRGVRRGVIRLQAPPTRFNVPVTAHRVFDGTTTPLADLKQMKAAVPGATINDAVLSVIGGALRTLPPRQGRAARRAAGDDGARSRSAPRSSRARPATRCR